MFELGQIYHVPESGKNRLVAEVDENATEYAQFFLCEKYNRQGAQKWRITGRLAATFNSSESVNWKLIDHLTIPVLNQLINNWKRK